MERVGSLMGRAPEGEASPPDASVDKVMAETLEIDPDKLGVVAAEATCEAPGKDADTQELPPPEIVPPPAEPMSSEELAITTADTQPLSPEIKVRLEHAESLKREERTVEMTSPTESSIRMPEASGEALLELDDFEPVAFTETDDVILDIDFDAADESYQPAVSPGSEAARESVEEPAYAHSYVAPVAVDDFHHAPSSEVGSEHMDHESVDVAPEAAAHFVDSDIVAGVAQPAAGSIQTHTVEPPPEAGRSVVGLDQLSPEAIDEIVRRVVAQMSEKAVQEIAWEVVPQLADMMIKKKLEEHEPLNH